MLEHKRLEIKHKTSEYMNKNDSVTSSMYKRNAADTQQIGYDSGDSEGATT